MKTEIDEIFEKISMKKKEADTFVRKYEARKMEDLSEYYKGASWAFEYTLKLFEE